MAAVRITFHALSAIAAVGLATLAITAWYIAASPSDIGAVAVLVPVAGIASLSGISVGALAILRPPQLSDRDRRLGHGILAALTVAGALALLLVGSSV